MFKKNTFIRVNKHVYIRNKYIKLNTSTIVNRTLKLECKLSVKQRLIGNIYKTLFDYLSKKKVKLINYNFINTRLLIVKLINNIMTNYNSYKHRISLSSNIYHIFLNFKKNRFFPYFYESSDKNTIFNNSLGILSRRFSLKKSFLKSKNSYMFSSSYLRRMLVYISVPKLNLNIKKTPKYLKELLIVLMGDSNVIYDHPFRKEVVNEKQVMLSINFLHVNFVNNKSLGPIKKKKKGRLKRKISKKIILYNNVLD